VIDWTAGRLAPPQSVRFTPFLTLSFKRSLPKFLPVRRHAVGQRIQEQEHAERYRDRGRRTEEGTADSAQRRQQFQFRASNEWLTGTHSRTTMKGFFGASGEQSHQKEFTADGDHPAVLCGADQGPTPVEWVLHALATCLTAGIANIAAVRGVTLHRVASRVEGDIDLLGIFGLSKTVRNGYQNMRITFEIEGDAPPEKLREIVEQSRARSAVYDVITNGIPVEVSVAA
jgi:uncharacterized OsmC-like protein